MKKTTFATRLKQILSIRNIKQIELSRITGIPKSAISQYLKGSFEPKQDRLEILAHFLNVCEAWLMGYDVPMQNNNSPTDFASDNLLLVSSESPPINTETYSNGYIDNILDSLSTFEGGFALIGNGKITELSESEFEALRKVLEAIKPNDNKTD